MNTFQIHNIPITISKKSKILSDILSNIQSKHQFLPIITFNISMLTPYKKDQKLCHWLIQNAMFTPDGISTSLLLYKKYYQWIPRYPGIDMVTDILKQTKSLKIALIGSKKQQLYRAKTYLEKTYPTHNICFLMDGYTDLTTTITEQINQISPDIFLVAKGCPKQDYFIQELSHHVTKGLAIGVGGSFDIWAKHIQRAPYFIRLLCLEWLYRLTIDPKRVPRFFDSLKWLFR